MASTNTFNMEYILGLFIVLGNIEKIIELIKPLFYCCVFYFTTYRFFVVTERERMNTFKGKLKHETILALRYDVNNNPLGWFVCLTRYYRIKYIANVTSYTYDSYMNIFIQKEAFNSIFNSDINTDITNTLHNTIYSGSNTTKSIFDDAQQPIDRKIKLYRRLGEYKYVNYAHTMLNIPYKHLYRNQIDLYNKIKELFVNREKNNVICLLSGDIGTGKSFFSYLLAREFNASICSTFNPIEPGDTFHALYDEVNPTKAKPLVIVLDEVDIVLSAIHNKEVIRHKNIPTLIYDKITWNHFLDQFDYGIYSNVILMMNTNKSKTELDKLDPSYLRSGRVDIHYTFTL
jgi:hypothetical protein